MVANSQLRAEIAGRSPIAKACGGVRVVLPGIDTAVFRPQDRNLFREHLDLPAGAFVIVTGGASLTDANKNVPWLFEQLSHLPDLAGVIVLAFGEGAVPVPDRLDVRFTGGIRERRELARLFRRRMFSSAPLMKPTVDAGGSETRNTSGETERAGFRRRLRAVGIMPNRLMRLRCSKR
jgi:hypothetical protein